MYINTFLGLADEGKLLYVHVLTGTAVHVDASLQKEVCFYYLGWVPSIFSRRDTSCTSAGKLAIFSRTTASCEAEFSSSINALIRSSGCK